MRQPKAPEGKPPLDVSKHVKHARSDLLLLLLPPELRNEIYSLVIATSYPRTKSPHDYNYFAALDLVHTCHQIRCEAFKMLAGGLRAQIEELKLEIEMWAATMRALQSRNARLYHLRNTVNRSDNAKRHLEAAERALAKVSVEGAGA